MDSHKNAPLTPKGREVRCVVEGGMGKAAAARQFNIGGMTGILLAGVFATASSGGTSGLIEGNPRQLLIQLYGVAVTLAWSGGVTYVLLKLVSALVPLRLSREPAMHGRDVYRH